MEWSDKDRRSIYRRGLSIRAAAAGVFLGFFGAVWASSAGDQISGLPGLLAVLVGLIAINCPLWLIGRRRGFPLADFRWHWAIDIAGVTGVIYCLGVLDVPLAIAAYMIMIVSSAAFGSRAAALWLANWATLCLVALVVADESGSIPHYHVNFAAHLNSDGRMVVTAGSLLLFYVFGWIGGELAAQLREKTEEIDSQKAEIEEAYEKVQNAHDRMILLSTVVRHDLYSPLGIVSGACREAIRSCDEAAMPEARRFVKMIDEHLQSIEGAVATLGLFGGGDSPEGEEWALWGVARKLVEDLSGECRDRQVVAVLEGEWPNVTVRREEFYHVLRNLVTNSVKAVESDGTGRILIRARREGRVCEVVVIDNGPGVSKDLVSNLQRTKLQITESQRPVGGFGVGLALVSNIVRGWGGEISHSGGECGGSEFVIRLPESCTRWVS